MLTRKRKLTPKYGLKKNSILKRKVPLKKSSGSLRGSSGIKRKKHIDHTGKYSNMMDFFMDVWDERCDKNGWCYCFETGARLGPNYRNNPSVYHHILPKSDPRFKNYVFFRENICILTPEVHNSVHTNIDSCPKVKELTNTLFRKFKNEEI